jgi:carboxymethylenebutenolidase
MLLQQQIFREVPVAAKPARQEFTMGNVLIPTHRGEMPAYLAAPRSPGRVPGIIVLHDAAGMSHDLRNQADWLAESGFLALAPALFHPGGFAFCFRTLIHDLLASDGPTFSDMALADIESARAWLSLQPGCNGHAGVIGFCMGGAFALLLASGHGFSASSVNYGGKLPADVATFLLTACPIVASYGAKDRWNQGVADQLERALERALVAHDVKEYPEAGHSFMNNHQNFFFKLLRFSGIAYNEQATLDARRRIIAFFRTHLEP